VLCTVIMHMRAVFIRTLLKLLIINSKEAEVTCFSTCPPRCSSQWRIQVGRLNSHIWALAIGVRATEPPLAGYGLEGVLDSACVENVLP
jgi:hypothetical protein